MTVGNTKHQDAPDGILLSMIYTVVAMVKR